MEKSCLKCKRKNHCPIEHGQKRKEILYSDGRGKVTAKYCRYYTFAKS
jgi:hypothetical protein